MPISSFIERPVSGPTTTIQVDKIASSTIHLNLGHSLEITEPVQPQIGDVVVVRTLTDNATYNKLELTSGRLARINRQDIVVGVLGLRRALRGFVGDVPETLAIGDRLHILNLGGVIGRCSGRFHGLGQAIQVELLGTVVRGGHVLNIKKTALPSISSLTESAPLVIIAGTSMNSGKTQAATEILKQFRRNGYRPAGAKLTGVACLRDTMNMDDHGAIATCSFLECGLPSTVGVEDLPTLAKTLIADLNRVDPDLIVIELGDGLLGGYHVVDLFRDAELMKLCAAVVFCAPDYVGAWGGIQLLREEGVDISVVSGASTDSDMGMDYIETKFGVPAANAINNGEKLYSLLKQSIFPANEAVQND
jgi:hypothetical protein